MGSSYISTPISSTAFRHIKDTPHHCTDFLSTLPPVLICCFQFKPMNSWIPLIPSFLDEIVRRDGPGSHSTDGPCFSCNKPFSSFRCTECFPTHPLLCQSCLLDTHRHAPLHHVQVSPPQKSSLYFSSLILSFHPQTRNGMASTSSAHPCPPSVYMFNSAMRAPLALLLALPLLHPPSFISMAFIPFM